MRLKLKNIVYETTDQRFIERLEAEGFTPEGKKAPEKKTVVEKDPDTQNIIEKTTTESEEAPIDLDKMLKPELAELLESKDIEFQSNATKDTLLEIAKKNRLGE